MMKFLAVALALLASPALAQLGTGQIGPGQIVGNSGTSRAPAGPETVTAILDRALAATQGRILCRTASAWQSCVSPVLGIPGTALGSIGFAGSTSGTVTVQPQAVAGTPTIVWPNTSGTVAVGASSPVVLSATTGNLTCPTCVTSSGGGAITGIAPINVTSAGVVSVTASALTKTDDTNVTLTLGGSPASALLAGTSITAGWTGTLAAGRLNSNVVQAITNDTNITGTIAAQNLTLGWAGTLAAGRLNSNVVQSVVNDTNVTGTIAAQALTLGWTGQLSIARGGTGQATAAAARGSSGLNIDQMATTGDANVTIAATTRTQATTTTLTAARTWTLPAANAVNAGQKLVIADKAGAINGANTITVQRAGSDTINGTSSFALTSAYAQVTLVSDGVSVWNYASASGGSGTVTSVDANAGARTSSGSAITTSGAIQLDGNYLGLNAPANCTLAASVAANALTVALKDAAGNDPTSTTPCYINFRSATAASGSNTLIAVTAANSLVVSSGASLGATNSVPFRVTVVGFNDAGTFRIGVVNLIRAGLNEALPSSSTTMSGSATSANTFYTGTAVTTKALRVLGYLDYPSGLTAAGTWSVGPTTIQAYGPAIRLQPGPTLQHLTSGTGATYTTPANAMSLDVECVGGGGGGQGGGSGAGNGGAGGSTTFSGTGVSLTAAGGAGGNGANVAGGAGSGGDVNLSGGSGNGRSNTSLTAGMPGGNSFWGGGGGGAIYGGGSGSAGAANTGGGGGGASDSVAGYGGGAAGGYVRRRIYLPVASYTHTIGAGGSAGAGANPGGAGAAGGCIVQENYH